MAQTPEILFKLVGDLSEIKPSMLDLSKLFLDRQKEIDEAEKKIKTYGESSVKEAKKINQAFQANIEAMKMGEKIFESFHKTGAKAFDDKKIKEFTKKVESEFKNIQKLAQFSIKFSPDELKKLSQFINSTDNPYTQLSYTISAMQGKLDALDFQDEKAKKLGEELDSLKPKVEALALHFDKAAESSSISLDEIKSEIQSVKEFITQTETELKNLDKQIENSAPGKQQAGLMQDRERLNQTLEETKANLEGLNQEYKSLQEETKKASNAQKSLNTELRNAKEEMAVLESEGEQNSERYKEIKERAVQLQKAIKDVNQEIKHSASNTAGLESVIGAINGLVGIYATAQGAAALFGEESEDLENTIQNLGGALAVLNGLQATQAELANRQGLANKALTYIQRQYTIATDASTTATIRLGAALKLLGIGLLVGALAAVVVYWKDIAKYIGLTSDEAEKNASITKKSNELYGEQIAKLTILNKRVKEGGLSFNEKKKAVKEFNEEFGKTLGSAKDYMELEKRLIENGEVYIKYLGLKAKAEAAYQLAVENQKSVIEDSIKLAEEGVKGIDKITNAYEKYSQQRGGKLAKNTITNEEISNALGLPTESELNTFLEGYTTTIKTEVKKLWKRGQGVGDYIDVFGDVSSEAEKLAEQYKIVGDETDKNTKKTKDWAAEIKKLINELVKLREQYAIGLIGNERDQQKAVLQNRVDQEAKAYLQQINDLKVSLSKKEELIREFNNLYNKETGLAYRKLREDLNEIDRQYEEQAKQAELTAIQAINEVNNLSSKNEIAAIKKKWEDIRKELRLQIQLTEDEDLKNRLNNLLSGTTDAEGKETNDTILKNNLERIDLEKEMADLVLKIYQHQGGEILKSQKTLRAMQLEIDRTFFNKQLKVIRDSLNEEKKLQLDGFINSLENAKTPEEINSIYEQMNLAFGDEMAANIFRIVEGLSGVNEEIEHLTKSNLKEWFNNASLKDFTDGLSKFFKLTGEDAKIFSENLAYAINTIWDTIQVSIDQNIQDHQNKLSEIENLISQTESQLDRERQLYEDGYANNYELRKKELSELQNQKAEEQALLRKAQKEQAAIQRTQIIAQTAMQISNLATAATEIFKGTTKINPIVGVALGAALVASLIAAFMAFKGTAQSAAAPTYRTGLEQGPLMLDGPSHERGGMGLYDSNSGRKVAEYEGGEQLFALNKGQQSKYGWLMQMMIDDAKGRRPIMNSLIGKIPVTGKKIIQKVRETNELTRSVQKKRAEASNEYREMLQEVKKLNKRFDEEFKGHRNERMDKTENWETTHFFYVKKNGVTKKFKKKKEDE